MYNDNVKVTREITCSKNEYQITLTLKKFNINIWTFYTVVENVVYSI